MITMPLCEFWVVFIGLLPQAHHALAFRLQASHTLSGPLSLQPLPAIVPEMWCVPVSGVWACVRLTHCFTAHLSTAPIVHMMSHEWMHTERFFGHVRYLMVQSQWPVRQGCE